MPSAAQAASGKLYIVQLKAPAVAAYQGGISGLPATSPRRTGAQRLDTRSTSARRYRSYLAGRQRAALNRLGARQPGVVYGYRTTFAGFAARLTHSQLATLRRAPEVAKVWRSHTSKVQTVDTANPVAVDTFLGGANGDGASYLGLPQGLWSELGGPDHAGAGVIVGDIDTGITPQHPSFADDSAGDSVYTGSPYTAPEVWNGVCQTGEQWTAADCNHKLIGARYYDQGFGLANIPADAFLSARDDDGHGSHTAATAAGNFGVQPSIFGSNLGVQAISGIAPRAYIAAYKVCWPGLDEASTGCSDADSIKAIDDAVADGVDVINYSIGGPDPVVVGPVEIAFLNATAAGVFVATSAGNDGPGASTIGNPSGAPWVTTVAASTLARTFEAMVTIQPAVGPSFHVSGASVTQSLPATEIVDAEDANLGGVPAGESALCKPGTLDPAKVADKVVLCLRGDNARIDKSHQVEIAGGAGMVLYNAEPDQETVTDNHWVPSVHVTHEDGVQIKAAIAGGTTTAALDAGTHLDQQGAILAAFSSRGPQAAVPDIPKPDVTAPGVNILAAASPQPAAVGGMPSGQLFQSISGTSMSSPHVAGAGALLTQAHPTWSPAEMKSALMTTADPNVLEEDGQTPATLFETGSGEIDPTTAADPGLVLDAGFLDYVSYLKGVASDIVPGDIPVTAPTDLNLPAIAASRLVGTLSTTRTFTSVDATAKLWTISVDPPPGFAATASPWDPTTDGGSAFQIKPGQSENVSIDLVRLSAPFNQYAEGALVLTNGTRTVRLPIAVQPAVVGAPDTLKVAAGQTSGSRPLTVESGFSGQLSMLGWGLAAPDLHANQTVGYSVSGQPILDQPDAGTTISAIDVPAGAQLVAARITAADGGNPGTDLDLYLFHDDGDGQPSAGDELVAQSASATALESVAKALPQAGRYFVAVVGWTTQNPVSTYDLTTWLADDATPDDAAGGPAIQVTSDPFAVATNDTPTATLGWSGVQSPGVYLGLVTYHDSATPTLANAEGSSIVELTRSADPPSAPPAVVPVPPVVLTPTPPAPMPAKLTLTARSLRLTGNRLVLRARLRLNMTGNVRVAVRRGRQTVARAKPRKVVQGTRTVAFLLSHRLRGGRTYTVTFTVSARSQTAQRTLKLRLRR
jgi:subtilisin family serine protease